MTRVERRERPLQRRQPVERHAGEVVVLEMVVRVEECEVPEPVAAHQRAPLRRIGGVDVVVLAEAVQRERDREDEEDREKVGARRGGAARQRPDQREHREMRRDRHLALERDAPLQAGRIGRALLPRGAEVDRKQRRRAVEQLEPAGVDLRRQVMPLGVVLVGAELRVVIEMPARELARRDAARHGVEPAERALRGGTPAREDGVVHDLVQQHREVEDGEPLDEHERDPDQRVRDRDKSPGGQREDRELPRRDQAVARGVLLVKGAHLLARQRMAELGPQPSRMLAVMMRFHRTYVNCTTMKP